MRNCCFILPVLLLLLYNPVQASGPSRYEIAWALAHPFAALKVKAITKKCMALNSQVLISGQLDRFHNGGKADAYRHVFCMAAYAQKIPVKKLRRLGAAHEKGNYLQFKRSRLEEGELADSLSCVMDLRNNELGFNTGKAAKDLTLAELSDRVLEKINTGQAVIMKRDEAGNYLDCQGKKIDPSLRGKSWSVPKCLVASDQ